MFDASGRRAASPPTPSSRSAARAAPWEVTLWAPWRALALRLRRWALRLGLAAALGFLLLWISLFLYGAFYGAYVPKAQLRRDVNFRFRTDCASPGPELCSFPTANVSLLGANGERVLLAGQVYSVGLQLELPECQVNRELGVFLVTATAYGAQGEPLGGSTRSGLLQYRSALLRSLEVLLLSGLFLGGFLEQKQTLELQLFHDYKEDPFVPSGWLQLEVHSRKLQWYRSSLAVTSQLTGLRYLLFHFPVSCAMLGVSANFSLLLLLLLGGSLLGGRGTPTPSPSPRQPQEERRESREPQGGAGACPEPEELGAEQREGLAANTEELPEAEGQLREALEVASPLPHADGLAPLPPPLPTPTPRPGCSSS